MGSFRTLTPHDVKEALSSFGLSGYARHSPIAAGTINTNIRVDTHEGLVWFLRINEGKAEDDVAREAAIVEHVAARGVTTPLPLRSTAGPRYARCGDAWASLFPWVAGKNLQRDLLLPEHARQVGHALAQLHAAGAGYTDHRPSRYETPEIMRRLETVRAVNDPHLQSAVEILGPELARLHSERDQLPLGLIHGDLFVDNVLFGDNGQLTALLDFEQASWGKLAYDVAVTVLAFGFGRDGFQAPLTRAFLQAYCKQRTPTAQEQQGFGAELRFAACRFAVTRITDVYLRRGQGSPGGKDFNRYLARLQHVKADWRAAGSALSLDAA